MKIVSWNLNHRICEKRIPGDIVDLFVGLDADVVLLNEFVDGPTRGHFGACLEAAGYAWRLVSAAPGRHNQVFAAARIPFSLGDIDPPSLDGSAVSNFLHLKFDETCLELVGLRVPTYAPAAVQHAYDAQLRDIMRRVSGRAIVFAGDFNKNPFVKMKLPDAVEIPNPGCDDYRVPNPSGDWSYMTMNGLWTSRVDHVVHTGGVTVGAPTYVSHLGDRILAGPRTTEPISDHAALTFTMVASDGLI